MASARSPKKTEAIEVRLPDETKAAFMDHCRRNNRTASDAIRAFITEQIGFQPERPHRRASNWRLLPAALLGAALGAGVAVPSLARSGGNDRPAFEQADRNHDGQLSFEEFEHR
jgi:hypothetical protein